MKSFAEKMKELRKNKNINQIDLATLVGVHPNTVSQWENGAMPRMGNIIKLAKIFDTTSEYLTGARDTGNEKKVSRENFTKFPNVLKDYSYIEKLVAANQMIVYENPAGERFFIPATTDGANFYERIKEKEAMKS